VSAGDSKGREVCQLCSVTQQQQVLQEADQLLINQQVLDTHMHPEAAATAAAAAAGGQRGGGGGGGGGGKGADQGHSSDTAKEEVWPLDAGRGWTHMVHITRYPTSHIPLPVCCVLT